MNNLIYLDTLSLFPTTEVTSKLMNKWHALLSHFKPTNSHNFIKQ